MTNAMKRIMQKNQPALISCQFLDNLKQVYTKDKWGFAVRTQIQNSLSFISWVVLDIISLSLSFLTGTRYSIYITGQLMRLNQFMLQSIQPQSDLYQGKYHLRGGQPWLSSFPAACPSRETHSVRVLHVCWMKGIDEWMDEYSLLTLMRVFY